MLSFFCKYLYRLDILFNRDSIRKFSMARIFIARISITTVFAFTTVVAAAVVVVAGVLLLLVVVVVGLSQFLIDFGVKIVPAVSTSNYFVVLFCFLLPKTCLKAKINCVVHIFCALTYCAV